MIEWTGWSLGAVLAAFGGFGAAVVALHFLRMRRRVVSVPYLRLWERVLADERRTRLFDLLKRWWSLLLALLVVGLLAFALGDPRSAGARAEGRSLVVLVDASASMRATDVAGGRFEYARKQAQALVDDMGPADRMLVAELADAPIPRSPLTDDPRVLRDAVDALESHATRADLAEGLRFARDVLRDASRPEVVIVSDGDLEPERVGALGDFPPTLSWVPVGGRASNVAVSAFAVRRYPLDKTQAEVLVEVWNPTEDDREVELQLVGDHGSLDVIPLEVPAGERVRRFFENVSGADQRLEARVEVVGEPIDVLAVDDGAYAVLPARRRARVLVVTEGNLYLEAALLLDEYLDVTTVTPGGYAEAVRGGEARFDAIVFDRALPPAQPPVSAFYLAPRGDGFSPVALGGVVERPFFDRVDDDHPLVRFTSLRDVNVAEATHVEPGPDDTVVAGTGDGHPLLVTGTRDGRRFVVLPFDLATSDLPLRVAWPLLLLHAIDWFAEEDAGFLSSRATGETWRVPVPGDAVEAVVVDPTGRERRVAVEDGRAVFQGEEVGFHVVRAGDTETLVAANLGPGDESELSPPESLVVGQTTAGEPSAGTPGARREPWWILVLLALLLVCGEWFLHHRRWTE